MIAVRGILAPAFLADLCFAAAILLASQVMHQLIPAVPICILLCQAPSITIFNKRHIPRGDYELVGRVRWGEIRKSQMPYPRAHLKKTLLKG